VSSVAFSPGVDRTNLQKWKKRYAHEFKKEQSGANNKPVGFREFNSLKREFGSIKEAVVHLRNVVHKSLTDRYINGE
jgi:hypothetical protein